MVKKASGIMREEFNSLNAQLKEMKEHVRRMQKREDIVEKRIISIKQQMREKQQDLLQTH